MRPSKAATGKPLVLASDEPLRTMNREEALKYIATNIEHWGNYNGAPMGWRYAGEFLCNYTAASLSPITRSDWQREKDRIALLMERIAIKPTIGLKPRKLHDEERIKAICEAVIRRAGNGQLPDKEWIEELADLIEGLHDKIGDGDVN